MTARDPFWTFPEDGTPPFVREPSKWRVFLVCFVVGVVLGFAVAWAATS